AAELVLDAGAGQVHRGGLAGLDVVGPQGVVLVGGEVEEGAVRSVLDVGPHPGGIHGPDPVGAVVQVRAGAVDGAVGHHAQVLAVGLDPLDEVTALRDGVGQLDRVGAAGLRIEGDQLRRGAGPDPDLAVLGVEAPGVIALGGDPAVLGDLLGRQVHGEGVGVGIRGAVEGVAVDIEGAQHLLPGDPGGDLLQLLRIGRVLPQGGVIGAAHAEVHGPVLGDCDGGGHGVRIDPVLVEQVPGAQV